MGGLRGELNRGIALQEEEFALLLSAAANTDELSQSAASAATDTSAAGQAIGSAAVELERVVSCLLSASSHTGDASDYISLALDRAAMADSIINQGRNRLQSASVKSVGLSLHIRDLGGHVTAAHGKAAEALAIYVRVADDEPPVPQSKEHEETVTELSIEAMPFFRQIAGQNQERLTESENLCKRYQMFLGKFAILGNGLLGKVNTAPSLEVSALAVELSAEVVEALAALRDVLPVFDACADALQSLSMTGVAIKDQIYNASVASLEQALQSARDRVARL